MVVYSHSALLFKAMAFPRVDHRREIGYVEVREGPLPATIPGIDAVLRDLVRREFFSDCRREIYQAVHDLRKQPLSARDISPQKKIVLEKGWYLKVVITLGIAVSGVIQVNLESSQKTRGGFTEFSYNRFHITPDDDCRPSHYPLRICGVEGKKMLASLPRSILLLHLADEFLTDVSQMHSPLDVWHQRLTGSNQYTLSRQIALLREFGGLAQDIATVHQASWTIGNLSPDNLMIIDPFCRVVISNLSAVTRIQDGKTTPNADCEDLLKVIGRLFIPNFSSLLAELKPAKSFREASIKFNALKEGRFQPLEAIIAQTKEEIAALQRQQSDILNEISIDGKFIWSKCHRSVEISALKEKVAQKEEALTQLQALLVFRGEVFNFVVQNLIYNNRGDLTAKALKEILGEIHAEFSQWA